MTTNVTNPAPVDVGQPVPDLVLMNEDGNQVALRELVGRRVVLYFYPKDDTPGCTTQACALRDSWSEFDALDDVLVYGVSPDDVASHVKFRSKFDLPFHLLVDEDHRLADEFGFWIEKQNYGRTSWGVERSTVIVGADGHVQAIARTVRPSEHLDWLKAALGMA